MIRLDPRESHHGRNVLRLGQGDSVAVFDCDGHQFLATVQRFENKQTVVRLVEPLPAAPETPVSISLYLAMAKASALDAVLPRAVELGVAEIVPFTSDRSVARIEKGAAAKRKSERWETILLSATKQCGRVRLTSIRPPCSFAAAVGQADPAAARICCVPEPTAPRLSDLLHSINFSTHGSVAIMIGPEGGLSPDEIALARDAEWHLVSLGPRILRVETAAAAALALVLGALREI